MFNEEGVLEAGIHNFTINDFKNSFINGFNTSQTRDNIYKNMLKWLKLIKERITMPTEIWLDGSYVTDKINPNDLDMVLFFDKSIFTREMYNEFVILQNECKKYDCDAYLCFANNNFANGQDINNRNYWRGQFGFDRFDRPKGIIKIDGNEFIDELKGVN